MDDLAAVDKLSKLYRNKPLIHIIRKLMTELGKLSPQGNVHAITMYSALNILLRCPPGPMLATMMGNPDFSYEIGGLMWQLNEV